MDAIANRLSVVKEYLTTAKIDVKEIQALPHDRIVNIKVFIESHIGLVENNITKPWIMPYLERLEHLRTLLINFENNKSTKSQTNKKQTNHHVTNDQTLFT